MGSTPTPGTMGDYLHARESGQLTEHTSAAMGEYLEPWLRNQEPTARKTTFHGYKRGLDRGIRCLGHVRLHELTPMQLETGYAEMMKSGSARGGPLWDADAATTVADQIFKEGEGMRLFPIVNACRRVSL